MKDYYKLLEVEKGASQDEIKKSYRKLAMKYHPDKNPDDKSAEEKFKECAEAFETLSDPDKRRMYDQYGTTNPRGSGGFSGHGFDMNDIFSKFGDIFGGFGGGGQRSKRGGDLRVKVSLTIDDIINGVEKKIKYVRQDKCKDCSGKGGKDLSNCGHCNGSGQRTIVQETPFGITRQTFICSNCNGEGKVVRDACRTCKGNGTTPKEEILNISIPKGSVEGSYLRMQSYGNFTRGGEYGDLQIVVEEIRDPNFTRDGRNLVCNHKIAFPDACLGSERSIKTPNGQISFTIKPGTKDGDLLRIKGKGVPVTNNGVGDLVIQISIDVPTNLTNEEKDLLDRLRNSKSFV